jgi:uncharacterized protein (TIGR03437 family)
MEGKFRKGMLAAASLRICAALCLASMPVCGGTFGQAVAIGGHAADLALDEARGYVYVANYTANRIELVSIQDGTVQTSINVPSQPASLSLSPDGRYLVIGHYGNFTAPNSPTNALTIIDMNDRSQRTAPVAKPVLGVAFGSDGLALIVTTTEFHLLNPASGQTMLLTTIQELASKTLPQPPATFPPNIIAVSVNSSGDGHYIYGLSDTFDFVYQVATGSIRIRGYTSTPTMGPRVVSVNRDGTQVLGGWVLSNRQGINVAQFPDATGELNLGSHAIDTDRGVSYSQVGQGKGGQTTTTVREPILQVVELDNLRVRERLRLPENLAGKSALTSDGAKVFAISDSGLLILPVGSLNSAARVKSNVEDLVFRGNFCDRTLATQELLIQNPGGGATDFSLRSDTPGVRVSPSSGVTPAIVRVTVDPNAFQNIKGTHVATIEITSTGAVNVIDPVRVLVNNREPDQRGTFVGVPGKLVDILADPGRDRFFVLRQSTNEVLVFDAGTYTLIRTLRTGNTPTQMAITFDKRWLLVGNNNSQIANVFDLETLEPSAPIVFPGGHYPKSLAASGKALLAATRVAGPVHKIDTVDFEARIATVLPTLGVYENTINIDTVLVASPSGSSIMAAQADGGLLMYSAVADTFTVSRKDAAKLGGAYAASRLDQFVVGNQLLNASLVPVQTFESASGASSGFAFVDALSLRTTTSGSSNPGIIQRVDLNTGVGVQPTRMTEAPTLASVDAVFSRTLAPLTSRNAIVSLTTSGFTVLPWNYDAATVPPQIDKVVNAADLSSNVAPGSLISLFGNNLSPVNMATSVVPVPTALGESCLTVNGLPVPMLFVSPNQINAQMPFQMAGNVSFTLRTAGGVSNNFNQRVDPTAPGVFRANAGPIGLIPVVVREKNNAIVTLSNPIRRGDRIMIMLTGLGDTLPSVPAGVPAPSDPPSTAVVEAEVSLGGYPLRVEFAGLSPGQVGVYQINASVPFEVPLGVEMPLEIQQGGGYTSVGVRVID